MTSAGTYWLVETKKGTTRYYNSPDRPALQKVCEATEAVERGVDDILRMEERSVNDDEEVDRPIRRVGALALAKLCRKYWARN